MTPTRPPRSRRMVGTVWVCCHAVSEPRLSLFFTGCGSNTTCTCTCRPHTSPLRHTSRPPRTMPCAAPPSHCWSTALWGTAPRSSPPCRTPGIPSPQPPNWDGAFEEERRGVEGERWCEFVGCETMDGDGRRMVLSRFTVPYLHANCRSPDVRRVSEDGNEGQEEKEDVGGGAHRVRSEMCFQKKSSTAFDFQELD